MEALGSAGVNLATARRFIQDMEKDTSTNMLLLEEELQDTAQLQGQQKNIINQLIQSQLQHGLVVELQINTARMRNAGAGTQTAGCNIWWYNFISINYGKTEDMMALLGQKLMIYPNSKR